MGDGRDDIRYQPNIIGFMLPSNNSSNLDRRVEIALPVEQESIKRRLLGILDISLRDNQKARLMQPDGTYTRARPAEDEAPLSSQQYFCDEALKAAEEAEAAGI